MTSFNASVTRHVSRAVVIDEHVLSELVRVVNDYSAAARQQYLAENDVTESQLPTLGEDAADNSVNFSEQLRLQRLPEVADQISRVYAQIQLQNGVVVSDIDPAEIASHSGIGARAIKKLTIAAGDYSTPSISVVIDNSSWTVDWTIRGRPDSVEAASARIDEISKSAMRLWWPLASDEVGIFIAMLPFIVGVLWLAVLILAIALGQVGIVTRAPNVAPSGEATRTLIYLVGGMIVWFALLGAFGQTFMRNWRRIFPRAEFNFGRNTEHVKVAERFRMGAVTLLFGIFISPYIVPFLLRVLQ